MKILVFESYTWYIYINEMEKVCVFCGQKPQSKTLEHVLPQWLIELTGDPKRKADFGYSKSTKGQHVRRIFVFDAFKFPSCRECNQRFANLEAGAKVIVGKMMSEVALSESELSILLDWFDKVRLGLWLGYLYLDKNPLGVSPHFHVQHRTRYYDRMLAIFKGDGNMKGLNVMGCDTPAFAQIPSCFSLRIDNVWFLNMSFQFLLARRMGLPFASESYLGEGKRFHCSLAKGRNRIMRPVLKKAISIEGTELYQPIFAGIMAAEGYDKLKKLYDTEYVRDTCISWEEGIGRIYIKNGSEVAPYSASPSMEWVPGKTHDFSKLSFDVQWITLEWQLYIMKNLLPSLKLLGEERKREAIKLVNLGKYWNMELVEHLDKVKRYRLS